MTYRYRTGTFFLAERVPEIYSTIKYTVYACNDACKLQGQQALSDPEVTHWSVQNNTMQKISPPYRICVFN